MSLSKLIKAKLKADGLTTAQAAKKAGITAITFKAVTAGTSVPNSRSLSKYASFLGISLEEAQKLAGDRKGKGMKRGPKPGKKAKAAKAPKAAKNGAAKRGRPPGKAKAAKAAKPAKRGRPPGKAKAAKAAKPAKAAKRGRPPGKAKAAKRGRPPGKAKR